MSTQRYPYKGQIRYDRKDYYKQTNRQIRQRLKQNKDYESLFCKWMGA